MSHIFIKSYDRDIVFPPDMFHNSIILIAKVRAIWTAKWFFSRVMAMMTCHFGAIVRMICAKDTHVSVFFVLTKYNLAGFAVFQHSL